MIKSGFFNQVYRDIIADNAALPSLPDVAHRIRRAMQDDDHDFETIARIVQTDVGVTASLIRMANSPLYYRRQPAMDVRAAIGRLGMEGTRDYVTICAMRAMYEARSPAVRSMMQALWEQSSELAALSAQVSPDLRSRLEHGLKTGTIALEAHMPPHQISDPSAGIRQLIASVAATKTRNIAMATGLRGWRSTSPEISPAAADQLDQLQSVKNRNGPKSSR